MGEDVGVFVLYVAGETGDDVLVERWIIFQGVWVVDVVEDNMGAISSFLYTTSGDDTTENLNEGEGIAPYVFTFEFAVIITAGG